MQVAEIYSWLLQFVRMWEEFLKYVLVYMKKKSVLPCVHEKQGYSFINRDFGKRSWIILKMLPQSWKIILEKSSHSRKFASEKHVFGGFLNICFTSFRSLDQFMCFFDAFLLTWVYILDHFRKVKTFRIQNSIVYKVGKFVWRIVLFYERFFEYSRI